MDRLRISELEEDIENAETHIAEIEIDGLRHRRVSPKERLDDDCTVEVLRNVKATMEVRKRELTRLRSYRA